MSMNSKIARSFIQGNQKQNRLLYIGLCVLFVFGIVIFSFQGSLMKYQQEESFKKYGAWSGAVYGGTKEIETFLKNEKSVESLGTMRVFENFSISSGDISAYVATVDQEMVKLGRMEMLKGALPKKNHEIVLDQQLLKRIAPDAKMGDQITIPILWSDGTMENCQFVLSGIMNTWSKNWSRGSYPLPAAFVSDQQVFSKNSSQVNHYFFLTDEKEHYAVPDLDRLLKENEDSTYIYNGRVYSPSTGADSEFFEKGSFIAMICAIGILVVFFLLSMVIKNIRYRITIMRNLGADVWDVYEIFMWEAFFIWRKAILLGVTIGLVSSGVMIGVMKHVLRWEIPFMIEWGYLLIVTGALSLTFFVGYFLITFSSVNKKIQTSYREDNSNVKVESFPKLKRIKPMTVFRLYKRNLVFYSKQSVLKIGISVIAVIVLNLSVIKFLDHYQRYQNIEMDYTYTLDIYDMHQCLGEKEIERIKEIPGIISVDAKKTIYPQKGTISVSWDGWKDNEYINLIRKYSYSTSEENQARKESDCFELDSLIGLDTDNPELVEWYAGCIDEGKLDEQKFCDGEQCMLVLSPFFLEKTEMVDKKYEIRPLMDPEEYKSVSKVYEYQNGKNGIHPGDKITLDIDGKKYKLEVGGIITGVTGFAPGDVSSVAGSGEVAVGKAFIDKVANLSETEYNEFHINSYANADHEETDWELTNLLTKFLGDSPENGNYYFGNSREFVKVATDIEMTGMLKAVFMIIITLLLLGFLFYHGTVGRIQNERRKIKILQFLGMTRKKIRRIYWIENMIEGVCAGLLGVIGAGVIQFEMWKRESGYTKFQAVMEAGMRKNPMNEHIVLIYALVFLLYLLIYLLLVMIPMKNVLMPFGNRKSLS